MKKIKFSIITPSLNSDKSLAYTLSSVYEQSYKNYEHIIVDGGSSDLTIDILKEHKIPNKKIILTKKTTIYEAINIGVKKASGDYVIVLNTDDIFHSIKTLENVANIIKKSTEKIYLGNVIYFNNYEFNKISRIYPSKNFQNWMFSFGLMPPHPGAFIEANLAKKNLYNTKFKIAADFDLFLRLLKLKKNSFKYIDQTITRMRTGGVSGVDIKAHLISSREIHESLKLNNEIRSRLLINSRYIAKIKQFFIINRKTKKFSLNKNYKPLIQHHFTVLRKIKSLNLNSNFVLSALNLAFLGSYMNNEVKIYKNLIHWPDGIFIKNIKISLKKIPGREVLRQLKLSNNIKTLTVFGNLPDQSKEYLKNRYNKKINHVKLPYGSISNIVKKINYKIKKNEIVMITLPTPKQEQLSEHLIKINKYYKIICIGGSINIVSGLEKEVPKLFYAFEFLWRLKYETLRRTSRLIVTFLNYIIGKYFKKKLNNISIKILN